MCLFSSTGVAYLTIPFVVIKSMLFSNPALAASGCMLLAPERCASIHGVPEHQPHDCLFNPFIQAQTKENIKAPRHWTLCDRWIPAQKTTNADNVSNWWHHHGVVLDISKCIFCMLWASINWSTYSSASRLGVMESGMSKMYQLVSVSRYLFIKCSRQWHDEIYAECICLPSKQGPLLLTSLKFNPSMDR